MKQTEVIIHRKARKEIEKLPKIIVDALIAWIRLVEKEGLSEYRKISGYHDEPLRGARLGQRSVRLNKAYRAFYVLSANGEIEIVTVIEVNKHDY